MARVRAGYPVYLSVGSNMGDKLGNCRHGIDTLTAGDPCSLLACSRFYRTSPVDYMDQDWFVNAAFKITTTLRPAELLKQLNAIQQQMGRKADAIRFGPRILDLDILLYDDRVIDTPELVIPHPRMHKRAFVLKPMCDINPTIVHPVLGKSIADLLDRLNDAAQQVIPLPGQPPLLQGRKP